MPETRTCEECGTALPDRPVAGQAARAQPTHPLPAEPPHGRATAVAAAGLRGWGWAGQARVGPGASLQTRGRGPLSVPPR